MNIELIVQERSDGQTYDLSDTASDVQWSTEFEGQPGSLTFAFRMDEQVSVGEGSVVRLKVDGTGVFFGYVFKRDIQTEGRVKITAYDQMRYLKNKNLYVIVDMSASDVFSKVCKDAGLKARVVNSSGYTLPKEIHDDRTYFEIIQSGIDKTLAYSGEWFKVWDNFGTLEFVNLADQMLDLTIGDASLLSEYSYSTSIDKDTYNQVKLVQENKQTQKREVYIVKSGANISKWGLLQYYENVTEDANPAQIKSKASNLLRLKNRVTRTLTLDCLGDLSVQAGKSVILNISELQKEGLSTRHYLVGKCTHKFNNNLHTMSLEMMIMHE